MDIIQRTAPVELSRKKIDNQTVQSEYKAGYSLFNVKSSFSGTKDFGDLLYQIILNDKENNLVGQRDL